MSDPIVEPSAQIINTDTAPAPEPAAPEAPPVRTDASYQEERAQERLERIVERSQGTSPPQGTPESQEPAIPRQQQAPSSPPAQQARPEQRVPLQQHEASRGFFGRVNQRAEAQARQQLAERMEQALARLPQQAPVAGTEQNDPEPDFYSDSRAWWQWQSRQQEARLQQSLQPFVEYVQGQRETEAQYHQRMQAEQQDQFQRAALADEFNYATALYRQSPEGDGFEHRLSWYLNDVGAGSFIASGVNPAMAIEMAKAGVQAQAEFAKRQGINPALFVDSVIRHHLAQTAQVLIDGGWRPSASIPPSQRRQPPPTPQQSEIASLRATGAGASSVAGIVHNTTAPGAHGTGISAVLADPSVENVKAFADAEYGGDIRKANTALRRALAQAGGA